jgi:hypothetical protein
MTRRIIVVAIVAAACLLVAAPAFGFNGWRGDYTTTEACQSCHSGTAHIPPVYNDWVNTKHAEDAEAPSAALSLPYGSVCAGCHTANYDPRKVTPSPSGTAWLADPSTITLPQADVSAAAPFSELKIGCSSCHYGANVTGGLTIYGVDSNDTAHTAPIGLMANADICGACHSRYSYAVTPIAVTPIPGAATPTPLIQPQMALGYPMLGSPAPSPATGWGDVAPLSDYLNIPAQGWSPTPVATPTGLGRLQTYWKDTAGNDTLWQQSGHDGSAAQYPEWKNEGHAQALNVLRPLAAFMDVTDCLKCHSADYRILKAQGENPTINDVQYGITCVGCHTPHNNGTAKGVWSGEFDDQVAVDPANGSAANGSNLCVECHNGEIPAGSTASPGAEVHHPMREMMDGYGAIDVASFPSVHKGKCIQCHMPPTSYSRGSAQLGGNHTFNIIDPAMAVSASPIPIATATAKATALPLPGTTNVPVITTTVTTTQASMPYSACSTCHDNNTKAAQVITSTTATPNPAANPLLVNVTVLQQAAGGDKGLWLQDTIEQRKAWTISMVGDGTSTDTVPIAGKVGDTLDAAAAHLGFADKDSAYEAFLNTPEATRTTAETNFLKAVTNAEYVVSEGSFGIHNWDYSRIIVNTALAEANSALTGQVVKMPWLVTLKLSKTSVKSGASVKFSGTVMTSKGVVGTGKVKIMKRVKNVWKNWKDATLNASGGFSKSITLEAKGTFYIRAVKAADASNLQGSSTPAIKLVVK